MSYRTTLNPVRSLITAAIVLTMTAVNSLMPGVIFAQQVDPASQSETQTGWAEIRVLDSETGHGIPLVELETVNSLRYVSDNAGRIAFSEPGLMNREIFFFIKSHGYEYPKDMFGYAGLKVTPRTDKVTEIRLTRKNVAERLCRLTGEGQYRDTILLGHKVPLKESPHPGLSVGQDSVLAAEYRGQTFWFWGDTSQMGYPLGLFRTSGATTELFRPNTTTVDLRHGLPYDYFVDPKSGFVRAMIPIPERPDGVIWIGGVCTVPDESGTERMVVHYSRRKGLVDEIEHGLAVFNDEKKIFEPKTQLPLTETWRFPNGHVLRHEDAGTSWLMFCTPAPTIRVPANLAAVLDPESYEAFTCSSDVADGKSDSKTKPVPAKAKDGSPDWRWQKTMPPTESKTEHEWVRNGVIQPQHARFCPENSQDAQERIVLHSGTVRWNPYRNRWILIAGQAGGKPSFLGEVWYAEAKEPTGPFRKAARLITHDRMTFYNVCHHPFLDSEDGRIVHFEGTYTHDFSGNPDKTPRYNYNQVLYRLDLSHKNLREVEVQ